MAITLSRDQSARLTASVRRFLSEQLDEEVGDMKARAFVDYALKEIGPLVYNQAVRDAERFMAERLGDLEATCYQKEFTWWAESKGR